jgi:hypothetical protein
MRYVASLSVCEPADGRARDSVCVAALCRLQGWLLKEGGFVKNWKRRWFAVGATCVYYFETPSHCSRFKYMCNAEFASVTDAIKSCGLGSSCVNRDWCCSWLFVLLVLVNGCWLFVCKLACLFNLCTAIGVFCFVVVV